MAVSTTDSPVSSGQRLRYAIQAMPPFSRSRYEKSSIGRFSPEERSAGVANPPMRPRRAMKTESRRVERNTATAVTMSIPTNAAHAGQRFHRPCSAKSVA
jgi:hypothetical protein